LEGFGEKKERKPLPSGARWAAKRRRMALMPIALREGGREGGMEGIK
jgi:hypothetical protein